jgi:hypothetical protein
MIKKKDSVGVWLEVRTCWWRLKALNTSVINLAASPLREVQDINCAGTLRHQHDSGQ